MKPITIGISIASIVGFWLWLNISAMEECLQGHGVAYCVVLLGHR